MTDEALAAFVTRRSAAAVTVTTAVEVLFAEAGSFAVATVAVLLSVAAELGARTLIVIAGAAPTARFGRVQVTVLPLREQVQPVPEALR
jgi:hypothetical protein